MWNVKWICLISALILMKHFSSSIDSSIQGPHSFEMIFMYKYDCLWLEIVSKIAMSACIICTLYTVSHYLVLFFDTSFFFVATFVVSEFLILFWPLISSCTYIRRWVWWIGEADERSSFSCCYFIPFSINVGRFRWKINKKTHTTPKAKLMINPKRPLNCELVFLSIWICFLLNRVLSFQVKRKKVWCNVFLSL